MMKSLRKHELLSELNNPRSAEIEPTLHRSMQEEMLRLYEEIEHLKLLNKTLVEDNARLSGQLTLH